MKAADPNCRPEDHRATAGRLEIDKQICRTAADLFRALGDAARLQVLVALGDGEMCVTELAQRLNDNLPAVSQRLKLLRSQRIVSHRREGKHVFYRLEDDHIAKLIGNALEHAREETR